METVGNLNKSKTSMSIEEFGKLINMADKALVQEKLRKYSLIDNEESSTYFLTPILTKCKKFESDNAGFSLDLKEDSYMKSPISIKASTKSKISIFSSGSSNNHLSHKKLTKIENPFKSNQFKQKLNFYNDNENVNKESSNDYSFNGRKHSSTLE